MANQQATWMCRPEERNSTADRLEINTLQRSLTRVDRGQVGFALHPTIPADIWTGERDVLLAIPMPGMDLQKMEVFLDRQGLMVSLSRAKGRHLEQSFVLPFIPDTNTLRVIVIRGTLYIHAVKPLA